MGYEDIEQRITSASSSRSASSSSSRQTTQRSAPRGYRWVRSMIDARRKVIIFLVLVFLLLLSLVGLRRQDQIKGIITDQQHAWSATASKGLQHLKGIATKTDASADSSSSSGNATANDQLDPSSLEHNLTDSNHHGAFNESNESKESASGTKLGQSDKAAHKATSTNKGPSINGRKLSSQSLTALRNRSLGFGEVIVLGMLDRTDKTDSLRLAASLTDFDFHLLPAVKGQDIPAKANPGDFGEGDRNDGVAGCWRGHMNFAARILEKKLATAIIMEDDVDWDIDLRTQLEHIALGAQVLQETPTKHAPHSPYGDGWDMLWLGHCASQPATGDTRRITFRNDRSVTPINHRTNFGNYPDMSSYDNTTRLLYFSHGGTCTYSYALSYKGAQKVLKYLSVDINPKPIDFGLHDMCSSKDRQFKCLGVFPQIIGEYKPAGPVNKDSDISKLDTTEVRKHGFSYNMVRSIRANFEVLLQNRPHDAVSQWPDDTPSVEGPIEMEYRDVVDSTEQTINPWARRRLRRSFWN